MPEYRKLTIFIIVILAINSAQFIAEANSPEISSTTFPELYYEIQIAHLNKSTELELFYNTDVQYYIDLFLEERNEQMRHIFFMSKEYFPLFEKYLEEYNLPNEIKYLPVLESGLSPFACSSSMAIGLWQFKEKTANYFGLDIDNYLDEREDPELSTIAACKYLSKLYKDFNNLELSLLAYNAGPTTIKKAISTAGNNKEYNNIHPFLSQQTQNYLPSLIAIIYLFHNFGTHF